MAATARNAFSSRSHTILTITVERTVVRDRVLPTVASRLNLVDLVSGREARASEEREGRRLHASKRREKGKGCMRARGQRVGEGRGE